MRKANDVELRGVYKLNASSITFTHGQKDILKVVLEYTQNGDIKERWEKVSDEDEMDLWFDLACDYIRKVCTDSMIFTTAA